MTRTRTLVVFCLALAGYLAFEWRAVTLDTLFCLTLGREVWEHGLPHDASTMVLGAGKSWQDQQWLAHLAMFGAYSALGYGGVVALCAASQAGAVALVARLCGTLGAGLTRTVIWVIAAAAGILMNPVPRAQSIGYLLLIVTLTLIVGPQTRNRRIALVAVLVVWGNVHGSAVLGVIACASAVTVDAIASWRAGRRTGFRGDAVTLAGICLALFATPYGLSIISYYRSIFGNDAIREIVSEWRGARFDSVLDSVFLLLLAVLICGVAFCLGRRVPLNARLVGFALPLGLAGTQALRSQVWFVLAAGVLLCDLFERAAPSTSEADIFARICSRLGPYGPRIAIGLAAACLVASAVTIAGKGQSVYLNADERAAVDSTALVLAREPDARVFASEDVSQMLLWRHPDLARGRVGFDIRYEALDQNVFREVAAALGRGKDEPKLFKQFSVLVVAQDSLLAETISKLPGWTSAARAHGYVRFSRVAA